MKKTKQQELRNLPVTLRLGKQGLTVGVLHEIKAQLKRKKQIKIRFLKTYPFQKDRKTEAERLAYILNAKLIMIRGNVIVLEHLSQNKEEKNLKKK